MTTITEAFVEQIASKLREADVFREVTVTDTGIVCQAADVDEATYCLTRDAAQQDQLYVGLYIDDRWISESVEADLMHTGDKMTDLLDEEFVDLGMDAQMLPVEHFRNDEKIFVFRSKVDDSKYDASNDEASTDYISKLLLGYEACFVQLGDMGGEDEED